MAKPRTPIVNVHFKGTTIPPFDAQLVELDQPKGGKPFMHLERKGDRWLLLHTDGCFGPEFPDHLELYIRRPADQRFLQNMDSGQWYEIKGLTKLNVKTPLFHIDQISIEGRYGAWRLTHSDGLMDNTHAIDAIIIDRC